jgi:hypothetical protein
LEFSRGGIYKALARLATKAAPTYQGLIATAREFAPLIWPTLIV